MKITDIIALKISAEQSIKAYNHQIFFKIKEAANDYFDKHPEVSEDEIKDVFEWFKSFENEADSLYYSLNNHIKTDDEYCITYKKDCTFLFAYSFKIRASILKGIMNNLNGYEIHKEKSTNC